MHVSQAQRWALSNWFLVVAPVLILAGWLITRSAPWAGEAHGMEAVLLFDACVTLPVLYALCYARRLALWQLAVRMIGVACLGIYLLTLVVPADAQRLLPQFAAARWVGLGLLVLIELRVLIAAIRLVFAADASAQDVAAKTGAPPLIAKLMVMEARMWKAVGRAFRRR
jgi:hypothetical protein